MEEKSDHLLFNSFYNYFVDMSVNKNQGQFLYLICSKLWINITRHKTTNINYLINYSFYFSQSQVTYSPLFSDNRNPLLDFQVPVSATVFRGYQRHWLGCDPHSLKLTQGFSVEHYSLLPILLFVFTISYSFAIFRPNTIVSLFICVL